MSTVFLERSDPTVNEIIKAAFPDYKGKKIAAQVTDKVTFHGTMWDEGNKNDYVFLRLVDFSQVEIPTEPYAIGSELHERQHLIPDGFIVVCHHQNGTRESITIFSPAANITKLLPPPIILTDDEKTVLIATRSYRSSYAGDSDYRFHEAKRYTNITKERWESAKALLITKGFLNKAGAITTTGKNAIGRESFP